MGKEKVKILIVDDEVENIHLLQAILEGHGYETISAQNGQEALEQLRKQPVDLIVSDILMPKMDGFRLCRECKKDESLCKIPFIFCTATYTDRKDEEFALSLGADRFLVKPIESAEFLKIIEDVLKENRRGAISKAKKTIEEETVYLREYSERLIRKLEDKNEQLQQELTERKKAEESLTTAYAKLQQTQAALIQTAKMASIGQLAAGLAHEINNPLTGVLNNVQLVKMLIEQRTDATLSLAELKDFFNAIEESALRCKKITQALLDFSYASKATLQTVLVNEIIEKVISLINYELRLQNIIIQTGFSGQLPLIQGNSQLLQQVFMNLITNAQWAIKKKSGTEGGTITIKTEHDSQKGRVNIYLSDTGIGMSSETVNRLFEPFFTTKEIGEGTGLGLSVLYGIIQEHKGTIEVESQLNQGTTFKISLPAFHQKETA